MPRMRKGATMTRPKMRARGSWKEGGGASAALVGLYESPMHRRGGWTGWRDAHLGRILALGLGGALPVPERDGAW